MTLKLHYIPVFCWSKKSGLCDYPLTLIQAEWNLSVPVNHSVIPKTTNRMVISSINQKDWKDLQLLDHDRNYHDNKTVSQFMALSSPFLAVLLQEQTLLLPLRAKSWAPKWMELLWSWCSVGPSSEIQGFICSFRKAAPVHTTLHLVSVSFSIPTSACSCNKQYLHTIHNHHIKCSGKRSWGKHKQSTFQINREECPLPTLPNDWEHGTRPPP